MQRRKREQADVKNCVRGSSASPTGLTAHTHVPVYSHVRCPTVLPWLEPPIWLEQAQCRPEHGNKRAVHQPWETILQRQRDFLFFTLSVASPAPPVLLDERIGNEAPFPSNGLEQTELPRISQ